MRHRITDEAKADVQRASAKYDDDASCGDAFALEVGSSRNPVGDFLQFRQLAGQDFEP